jgi:CBS domain-containing protein
MRADTLVGVITVRELMAATTGERVDTLVARPPVTVHAHETARAAVERMATEDVGRLVMVDDDAPGKPMGIVTRSDIVAAFAQRAAAASHARRTGVASRNRRTM